jgi:hypothetical protein
MEEISHWVDENRMQNPANREFSYFDADGTYVNVPPFGMGGI